MNRILIIAFIFLGYISSIAAQDESEQVLVFRSTGEVNLFYSNQIDSIECSHWSIDSVWHDDVITQVFYTRDTTLVIPLEEIDSVAFGNRNIIEFENDVKELTPNHDLLWIIRFDGSSIFYKPSTPSDVLPLNGQKLFYGYYDEDEESSALFPYGLCAKVTQVSNLSSEIRVDVQTIEPDEIFKKLFYAGPVSQRQTLSKGMKRASVNGNITLPLGGIGEVQVNGEIQVNGNAVISLPTHYYHTDLDIALSYNFEVNASTTDNATINYEELSNSRTIATFYRVLNVRAAIGAFADLKAELSLGLEMERTYNRKLSWTRHNGENTFFFIDAESDEPYKDKASIDLTLDGSVYFGPILRLDFSTVGDLAGARAKLKIGPEITGQLSMGILRDMRDYNPEYYGLAQLDACAKVGLEGYAINRSGLVWGDVVEHKIFEIEGRSTKHTLNLFPQYEGTRGVQADEKLSTIITVSTKSPEEIVHEIESGFELVDNNDQIVDSVFVQTIKANDKSIQGISYEFTLPKQSTAVNGLRVRPVFHYADLTISADYASVQKGFQIQPVIFCGSNGAVNYAASYPFAGEVTNDKTNYRAGAYLAIGSCDTVFKKDDPTINVLTFIDESILDKLIGTWQGTEMEQEVEYIFNEDFSGSRNALPFTYDINVPQCGQISLYFEGNDVPMILSVIDLQYNIMRYRIQRKQDIYTLTKQ